MIGVFLPGSLQKNQDVLTSALFNSVIEFAGRDVKVIDFYKSNKLEKLLTHDVEVIKFDANDVCDSLQDWNKVYDACVKFLESNGIDTVICCKMLMSGAYHFGNEANAKSFVESIINDSKKCFNFAQVKKMMFFLQFIRACSEVCDNFYQYVVDPQELVLSKVFDFRNFKCLYFNSARRRDSVVMPFYEFQLNKDSRAELGEQKVPFTFYCSAVTDDRKYIADMQDEFESIDGWDVNIGTKDSEHKKRMTSQDEYMFMLSQSKCSLVIKPYDHEAFSWLRFVECIYNNCLPFVWGDCNFQDIDKLFDETSDIIKQKLLVNSIEELKDRVNYFDKNESERQELIESLKSSIEKKHVLDFEWLCDRWQKLPGLSC